ncbi:hypothetical protein IU459_15950 [Nocardia amamiensis]|uniref:Uncharacterized protein n=1 Tax=Nocardia amamiensis TaxID=404578 RepID=A0ABS0CR58_9NOCA|nr:hypothetical protein [Nocardia amamiensis]MBF6299025.1 hypothetical protein [Nocardia amamiensis]
MPAGPVLILAATFAAVIVGLFAVAFPIACLVAWLLTDAPPTGPRVREIDERLSHEPPPLPLTVEQARQQWARHIGCRLGCCARKREIQRTLRAAGVAPPLDTTSTAPTRRGGRHAHPRRKA